MVEAEDPEPRPGCVGPDAKHVPLAFQFRSSVTVERRGWILLAVFELGSVEDVICGQVDDPSGPVLSKRLAPWLLAPRTMRSTSSGPLWFTSSPV